MNLAAFIREAETALCVLYPPEEARSMVRRLTEDLTGLPSYAHVIDPGTEVPEEPLRPALARLMEGEPLQYVTGVQYFCGRPFRVTPAVLIPRPETEQMVDAAVWRLRSLEGRARVLDLCTGSGCIAWSVALEVPGTEVIGLDISEEALDVARSQMPDAGNDKVRPLFVKGDVLIGSGMPEGPFDLLLSNPPYVRESERQDMRPNVLGFEPELALFVPDEDPLLFYRAIAVHAMKLLAPGGWGMVEINEALGDDTAGLFRDAGFEAVEKSADFFGRDRFVSFLKPL